MCGKPMEKVPRWLEGVQVTFVCNNCPNRQIKNITQVTLEPTAVRSEGDDIAAVDDLGEDEEEL